MCCKPSLVICAEEGFFFRAPKSHLSGYEKAGIFMVGANLEVSLTAGCESSQSISDCFSCPSCQKGQSSFKTVNSSKASCCWSSQSISNCFQCSFSCHTRWVPPKLSIPAQLQVINMEMQVVCKKCLLLGIFLTPQQIRVGWCSLLIYSGEFMNLSPLKQGLRQDLITWGQFVPLAKILGDIFIFRGMKLIFQSTFFLHSNREANKTFFSPDP